MTLNKYSELIFEAFLEHARKDEIINKKTEIVDRVLNYHNIDPKTFLFTSFNPAMLGISSDKEIYLDNASPVILTWLKENSPNIKVYNNTVKIDCIVAMDEYFTFIDSEQEQIDLIKNTVNLAQQILITTIKDYKNIEFKDREHSTPAVIKHAQGYVSFNEMHNWSFNDQQKFQTSFFKLSNSQAELKFNASRRAAYFKQLAKFSADASADSFVVHKNLMYKSLLRKNYEHVISITK